MSGFAALAHLRRSRSGPGVGPRPSSPPQRLPRRAWEQLARRPAQVLRSCVSAHPTAPDGRKPEPGRHRPKSANLRRAGPQAGRRSWPRRSGRRADPPSAQTRASSMRKSSAARHGPAARSRRDRGSQSAVGPARPVPGPTASAPHPAPLRPHSCRCRPSPAQRHRSPDWRRSGLSARSLSAGSRDHRRTRRRRPRADSRNRPALRSRASRAVAPDQQKDVSRPPAEPLRRCAEALARRLRAAREAGRRPAAVRVVAPSARLRLPCLSPAPGEASFWPWDGVRRGARAGRRRQLLRMFRSGAFCWRTLRPGSRAEAP